MSKAERKNFIRELAEHIHTFFSGKANKPLAGKTKKSIEKAARQLSKKHYKVQKPVTKKKSKAVAKPKKKSVSAK